MFVQVTVEETIVHTYEVEVSVLGAEYPVLGASGPEELAIVLAKRRVEALLQSEDQGEHAIIDSANLSRTIENAEVVG